MPADFGRDEGGAAATGGLSPEAVRETAARMGSDAGQGVRPFAIAILVLSVTPFVLGLLGFDFGPSNQSPPAVDPGAADPTLRLLSGPLSHAILGWTALCAAGFTAVLAFAHYAGRRDPAPPIVGAALFWAAWVGLSHGLAPDNFVGGSADSAGLLPLIWDLSRAFKALVPAIALVLLMRWAAPGPRPRRASMVVAGASLGLGGAAWLTIRAFTASGAPPGAMGSGQAFGPPEHIVLLLMLLAAGLFVYPRYHRSECSLFSLSLLLAVVPSLAVELHLAFGSTALFDHHFTAAHGLEVLAYATPGVGLILDSVFTHRAHGRSEVLLATLPDLVFRLDAEGTYIEYFGDPGSADLQMPPEAFLGRRVTDLLPPFVAAPAMELIGAALSTGEVREFEYALPLPTGTRSFEARIAPLPGREVFILARDMTARVQASEALAERVRDIEQRAGWDRVENELTRVFDREAPSSQLLRQALDLLVASEQLKGACLWLLDDNSQQLVLAEGCGTPPELMRNFAMGEGLVGGVAARGEQQVLSHNELPQAASQDGDVQVVALPLAIQGELLGVLVVGTAGPLQSQHHGFVERAAERIALSLHATRQVERMTTLTEQLNDRQREITRQNAELEHASRMKSEFLANMSHELRTPLNAIIGFSEVLKDRLAGELTQEQADYATEVFQSGQHLLSLINDILDVSKIEAGRMELHIEQVDGAGLAHDALTVLRGRAAARDIRLSSEVDESVGRFQGDSIKLRQIVFNLMSNAVKFTDPGGSVRLEMRRIRVGEVLEIAVSDTGIGIAEEEQENVFQPFRQVDSSLSRKHEGSGLGLALVRRLAELHGGTVGVESELGVGSRFSVRLPYQTC